MRLSWQRGLLAALLAAGLITVAGAPARTADDKKPADKADADKVPFAGNWKVRIAVAATQEITYFIVKIADKDGKPDTDFAWVLPQIKNAASIEDAKIEAGTAHFTIKFGNNKWVMSAKAPKDAKGATTLLGTAKLGNNLFPLTLEKTDDTEVAAKDVQRQTPGSEDLQKVQNESDPVKKTAALKELIEKNENQPIALAASAALFNVAAKHAKTDEEVAAALKQYQKIMTAYGPELEDQALPKIAGTLVHGDKGAALALEYAHQVEKGLDKDASPAKQVPVLKLVAAALHKNKKDDEAKVLEEKAAKLDKELDEEFEKVAIPFEPEEFKGRKAASHRVAVVELFTGAHCPPCVSADIAFDAAAKTFKPKDVVFLEYHLHIPRPDPLTNADAVARQDYYGVNSTPTALVDGKAMEGLGGLKQHGKDRYETLRKTIEDALETDAPAEMQVKLQRKGDKVEVETRVVDLKKPDEKLRLHVVLVENVVRYPGTNGQRLHHDVVRAFPGGTKGVALKEATTNNKVMIDLAEVSKKLGDYLDEAGEKIAFLDDERPTKLGHLKVIAFIQDEDSKEILQAAEAEVPAAK
jgi:hypothetical protein